MSVVSSYSVNSTNQPVLNPPPGVVLDPPPTVASANTFDTYRSGVDAIRVAMNLANGEVPKSWVHGILAPAAPFIDPAPQWDQLPSFFVLRNRQGQYAVVKAGSHGEWLQHTQGQGWTLLVGVKFNGRAYEFRFPEGGGSTRAFTVLSENRSSMESALSLLAHPRKAKVLGSLNAALGAAPEQLRTLGGAGAGLNIFRLPDGRFASIPAELGSRRLEGTPGSVTARLGQLFAQNPTPGAVKVGEVRMLGDGKLEFKPTGVEHPPRIWSPTQ